MYNKFAYKYNKIVRTTSTISIAILSVGLVSVASATPTSTAISKPYSEIKSIIPSEIDDTSKLQARKGIVTVIPSREFRFATSKDAKDWKGYEKSMYRGKYYHKDQEHFRECVMQRESRHNYRAANKTSSAKGAYQFLENNWHDGLIYMMIKESKKSKDGLIPKIKELRTKPIVKWNRYYQDRAFFTAMNINGKWSGKHHWRFTVPGTGC